MKTLNNSLYRIAAAWNYAVVLSGSLIAGPLIFALLVLSAIAILLCALVLASSTLMCILLLLPFWYARIAVNKSMSAAFAKILENLDAATAKSKMARANHERS